MDSLLDTMTNVVGILVIVLVVTQLGVGDAVERISQSIKIDPEDIAQKQEQLSELDEKKLLLNTQLQLLDPGAVQDDDLIQAEIQSLSKQLADEALKLDNLKKRNSQKQQNLLLMEKESADQEERRKELEKKIQDSLTQMASLRATLDETPERETVPPKELRLPDPRPAPEGVRPLNMICKHNRVYPLAFSDIQLVARDQAQKVLATKRFLIDPVKGIDAERFVKEFAKRPMRHDFYDISLVAHPDGRPRLHCTPKERSGATLQQVERRGSNFNDDLSKVDPSKFYIQFFVCSDSYDIYLSARAQAEANGISVGWVPQPPTWNYVNLMGGDIRLGPPKPPPTAPKAPPQKTAPRNVID